MSPSDRFERRGRDVTRTGRVSPKPRTAAAPTSGSSSYTSGSRSYTSPTTAGQGGERFSAVVVAALIFASTGISLYDLYLILTLLGR